MVSLNTIYWCIVGSGFLLAFLWAWARHQPTAPEPNDLGEMRAVQAGCCTQFACWGETIQVATTTGGELWRCRSCSHRWLFTVKSEEK